MKVDLEQALVKTEMRRWRNIRSGWLVIWPERLVIYRRKFIGGLEEVEDFKTNQLIATEQDTVNKGVRATFRSPQGEPTDEVFSFLDGKHAETVNTVLADLLKEAEEQKKSQEQEAARLEMEQQEHQRQIREAFACDILETSEVLWLITRANYSMVNAVIVADWGDARRQYSAIWQQAERLKKIRPQIEITAALEELDGVVSSNSGQEVIEKASYFLKQMSKQVIQTEAAGAGWRSLKESLSSMSPNCNHLPYFLLFSAGYSEALMAVQIEDWSGVNKVLRLLRSSSTILQRCFYFDLDSLIDAATSAVMERNRDSFSEAAQLIERAILASFKANTFNFGPSALQLEEKHHGSVSE